MTARAEALPADLVEAIDRARSRLGSFSDVRCFADVESTNDIALTLASHGAAHGVSVLADTQRAGRGRRGRAWHSPPGMGMYLSVVLRLPAQSTAGSLVTLAVGVAVAEAITLVAGLPIELKWPNDLVIGTPWRKAGGVLCESSGVGGVPDAIVAGVGVNISTKTFPPDVAGLATSLELESSRAIDRSALVVECLARIRARVSDVEERRSDVLDSWRRLGRRGLQAAPVRWVEHGIDRHGVARDIAADGALLVDCDGRTERLIAGEVFWQGLSYGA